MSHFDVDYAHGSGEHWFCRDCGRQIRIGGAFCIRCRYGDPVPQWPERSLFKPSGFNEYSQIPRKEEAVNINSAFSSKYLKHSDLNGKHVMVTMERVEVETVGQGTDAEQKPVLYFKGHDKGLVLNKTNAFSIADIVGSEDTENWSGQRIVLYQDRTMFQGKPTACIRITAPPANGKKPAPPPPPVQITEGFSDDFDDFQVSDEDVPF